MKRDCAAAADSPGAPYSPEACWNRVGIVARSAQFVYALLGPDHDGSRYTQQGEQIARIAASGVRLVIEEFRTDETKTLKSGDRGRLRINYGDPRQPEQPIAWLWRFVDGARTAGELYGRGLVVIAAEQYASRLVVPQSQRVPAMRWSSHKDHAAKALKKLAGPHLPGSLAQLERAVKRAHRELEQAEASARAKSRRSRKAPEAEETGVEQPVEELAGEAEDDVDEDLDELGDLAADASDESEAA